MKYTNLPLLQVCLVFFFGIWFGFSEFSFKFSTYVTSSVILFTLFTISFFVSKTDSKLKSVFTVVSLLFLFSLGFLNTKIHLPKHQKDHYSHFLSTESIQNNYIIYEGEVVKSLKSSAFKDKYEVRLTSLNDTKIRGKVLLQVPTDKDSLLNAHSKVVGFGKIKAFTAPQNPQQFNYKEYMWSQQMSHVINSDFDQFQIEEQSGFSFRSFGEQARNTIENSLSGYPFSDEQLDIIQALLLGQKQNVDPETYNSFSKAGVVHILAVSGLHVGIILLILQFITKGLLRIKYGRLLREIVVLTGIWGFATLAGFTPSVLRAAVMFSFLSVALNYKRKTSAINTLALSAIFLIIINPYFIYQVGFQLSYLAVLSIVALQPRLSKIYEPKFYLDRKIWDIVSVTITAQLGVLPLSLYYFHQFPGLFILSNLVILPGLGVLLGGGILIIFLSLLKILPDFLAHIYGQALDLLLSFVNWIASKEYLVFSDIYFTKPMLISSVILLLSLILWDKKRKMLSYSLLNLSLLALIICIHVDKRNQLQQEEIVVFQTYRNSQLGELKGSFLNLYSDK
ncbi:MAG: ComEC/Rec2 family competence protein, partial [Psychroflexus sp.]